MKKVTYLLLTALLAACSNNTDNDPQPVEYGTISLGISNDESVTVSPREAATSEQLGEYKITTKNNGTEIANATGKYNTLTFPMTLEAKDGYTVEAESCTIEESLTDRGKARLYGISDSFAVEANTTTTVSFTCKRSNAQVQVTWDSSITANSNFTSYSLTLCDNTNNAGRIITFDNSTNTGDAYFSPGTLTYEIKYTFNDSQKTATSTIAVAARDLAKLTVKASGANGGITLSITIDDTTVEQSHEATINPYA